MIKHHPDEATLMSYAAGALNSNFASLVEAHLELCPHCREKVSEAEQIGAALVSNIEHKPVGNQSDAFEQLWQKNIRQSSLATHQGNG